MGNIPVFSYLGEIPTIASMVNFPDNGLCTTMNANFLVNTCNVFFYCFFTDVEMNRNLSVRHTLNKQIEYFVFSL